MLSEEGWERVLSNCPAGHMMTTLIIIEVNYMPGTILNAFLKSIHLTLTGKA